MRGILDYPLPMPYAIAETIKGFGFHGAGENAAHNLPLPGSPHDDAESRRLFNASAAALWVAPQELSRPWNASPPCAPGGRWSAIIRWQCVIPHCRKSPNCTSTSRPARR
ncbi:hypothetical protein D9M71_673920 [compost metagenome]